MRRHLLLAAFLSAPIGLLLAAGCSSSDGDNTPDPDAGVSPDATKPTPDAPVPDASAPDATKPEAGPHEPGWDPSFSLPGVAGRIGPQISAMARVANRQIALAGNFEQAGSIPTKFVALWNGNQWLSISTGLTEGVGMMVATPNGELFATVGDGTKLFKWNKTAWSEFATFDGWVRSLDVAPDGTLYAAGWFTAVGATPIAKLAKLSGNTWSEVPNVPDGTNIVRVVGARLCIGGSINAGALGIQCLENGTWQDKPFPHIYGDITDIGEQNGDLVAAGRFQLSEDELGGNFARWDGSKWELIGGGVETSGIDAVKDMVVDGDKIYVTGNLKFAGGNQVSHVAMWDTTQKRWSTLNDGIWGSSGGVGLGGAPGQALALDQGGELYVGGSFACIGGRNALGVARWDGNQWNAVDDPKAKRLGVNGSVLALAEGSDGALYAGGQFPFVGGDVVAANVARFENDAWSSLGLGFDGPVHVMAVSGSTVYAGGEFLHSGPLVTRHVARWNGATWAALGGGLNGRVATLAVGPDGNVYAGGDFTEAGSVVANRIAKWNGAAWAAIGSGFDAPVNAIGFDAAGNLYAGGEFTKSGATDAKHIAVWNGTSWSTVGAGVAGEFYANVKAIVTYDGKLTIGGHFDRSGTATVASVASWDGNSWGSVGGGVRSVNSTAGVTKLAVRGNQLYVVGNVAVAGTAADGGAGATVNGIAMWNGTTWSDLEGGLSDMAEAVLVSKNNFWVAGGFTFAGNQGSYNVARYWFDK